MTRLKAFFSLQFVIRNLFQARIMKYNYCVPGCNKSHRNRSIDLKFYCTPKDQELRKTYDALLKNDSLKMGSSNTHICSKNWVGGQKLSRTHLPSVYPWSLPAKKEEKFNGKLMTKSTVIARKEAQSVASSSRRQLQKFYGRFDPYQKSIRPTYKILLKHVFGVKCSGTINSVVFLTMPTLKLNNSHISSAPFSKHQIALPMARTLAMLANFLH